MRGAVRTLPNRASVDAAWTRYAAIVRRANDDKALWEDREHIQSMIRAYEEFRAAFLAMPSDA